MKNFSEHMLRNRRWIIIGLLVFVVALSFAFFQQQSLRLDEAQSLYQTSHTLPRIFEIIGEDVHVPLYHVLLHFWQFIAGSSVAATRAFSLIFFLLSIPALYALGKRMFSPSVGLFAATLLAISPFMNWYGNEVRMYSLFVFLAILNTYFFVGIYKVNDKASRIGFAITAILGMYCHYFFALILATNALFFLFNRELFPRDALRYFIRTAIVLLIAFLPWIYNVYIHSGGSNTTPNLVKPTSINVVNTFSQFIFGFQTDHLNTILVSLWPLTVLLGFLALRKHKQISSEAIYLVMAFIVPNILAFIISITYQPVYIARYLIFTLPPMYLLLSWILFRYPFKISLMFRTLIIFVMIATLTVQAASAATPVKENYRQATEYIERNSEATDVIVVSAPFTIYPVLYYYRGPLSIKTIPIWDQTEFGPIPAYSIDNVPGELEQIRGNYRTMWFLQSYDQGYEEELRIYMDTHLERLEHVEFSPGLNLYKYKLRYD